MRNNFPAAAWETHPHTFLHVSKFVCVLKCLLLCLGLNRTVVYSLVDSVGGFFSIDPVSGIVILEKTLDRESQDTYRVRVRATDQAGQEGALSSQVVGPTDTHPFNLSCIFAMLCSTITTLNCIGCYSQSPKSAITQLQVNASWNLNNKVYL